MVDQFFTVIGSILILAIVTTALLPGRQTPGVLTAFFGGLATAIRAAMGGK